MTKKHDPLGPLGLVPAILHHSEIDPGERYRKDYDDGGDLEASVKEVGFLQSLLVQQVASENGTKYLLLAGGRRLSVAQKLDLNVPVFVSTKELDELDIRTIELWENVKRKELSYEEDLALTLEIHRLQTKKHGKALPGPGQQDKWSPEKTAKLLGRDRSTVAKDLVLAEAIEKLPELRGRKNKAEARQLLDMAMKQVVIEQRVQDYKDQNTGKTDAIKTKLIKSYIVSDFFAACSKIPDSSIDLVELDPDYGNAIKSLINSKSGSFTKLYSDDQYTETPPEAYVEYLGYFLKESHRILSPNGWLLVWFAINPWFEPTYQAIIDSGFVCNRVPAFYIKPSGASYNPQRLLSSCVDVFFYARKGPSVLNKSGRHNTFNYKAVHESNRIHPTEKPIELYEDILTTFVPPNSRVVSPCVGSGNIILAASNVHMHATGYDLSDSLKNAYTLRVMDGEPGTYKSFKG